MSHAMLISAWVYETLHTWENTMKKSILALFACLLIASPSLSAQMCLAPKCINPLSEELINIDQYNQSTKSQYKVCPQNLIHHHLFHFECIDLCFSNEENLDCCPACYQIMLNIFRNKLHSSFSSKALTHLNN